MPLDASIILGARPIELPDPVANASRFYGLLAARTQADEGQRARARQDAGDAAYTRAAASGTFDRKAYLAELGRAGLGSEALAAQSKFAQEDLTNAKTVADTTKAQRESALFNLDAGARLFGGVQDQAGYDAAMNQARALGLDTASFGLGPQFDPVAVGRAVDSALSAKDRIEAHHKEQELIETTRAHQESERLTGRGQDMTARTAANEQRVQIRGQDVSAATARRGQDITVRGQNMTDARARAAMDPTQIEAASAARARGALGGLTGGAGGAGPGLKPSKIPAEITARLALGRSWIGQANDIKAAVTEGGAAKTGLGILTNTGKYAEAAQRQESGVDALLRNLTGAGMSVPEAERYAKRYSFSATDSTQRKVDKVNQLARELSRIDRDVTAQYGQTPSDAYAGAEPPRSLSAGTPLPQAGNRAPLPGKAKSGAAPVAGHAGWSVTVK